VRYHQAVLFTLGRQFESALDLLKGFAREQLESATILDAMGMAVLRIHAPFEKLTPEQRDMVRQFGKAEFLAGERKAAESLTAYQELEERYRGQPDVAYASGLAFVNLTEYEKAEAAFKRELERDPRHAPSLVKLALLAIQRSRYPEGLPYAEQAAAIDSESFAAHYALGRIYLELNEVDKAVTVLEKAAKIAPSIPSVQFVLSRAYTRAGRSQDAARARAEFQRLEELDKQRRGEAASTTEAGATPQQPSAARR